MVRPTGCGKTTLIELLVRIYNPPHNSIYVDGYELYKIPLSILRRDMVLVPQDIFLFSESIADNIRLGKPDASDEEVFEAARIARVYDEIMEFEHQFGTIVGERGLTLPRAKTKSCNCRALLTNSRILILDDALSAVDTKTERHILERLIEIRKAKTTIIIAHRISSLRHSDMIIVINNSIIAESGTHQDLLAKGEYIKIYMKNKRLEPAWKEKKNNARWWRSRRT